MLNYDEDLTELVESLICTGREDDWWDFKECYHEDRAALLHDIICSSSFHSSGCSFTHWSAAAAASGSIECIQRQSD